MSGGGREPELPGEPPIILDCLVGTRDEGLRRVDITVVRSNLELVDNFWAPNELGSASRQS